MDFIVTIENEDSLVGLTWAREQHNNTLTKNDKNVGELKTDDDYLQYVMEEACKSYGLQKALKNLQDQAEVLKVARR